MYEQWNAISVIFFSRLRQQTEEIFCYPVLLQFFTSLMIFAMTGFQATVKSGSNDLDVLIYFYCGCIFCQLFVYCWFGNEVFEQVCPLKSTIKLKFLWLLNETIIFAILSCHILTSEQN